MKSEFFSIKRKPYMAAAALLIFLCLSWLIYVKYIAEPKPKSESREDLIAFLASDDFKRLPLEKQKYYVAKLRGGQQGRPNFRQMRQDLDKLSESERHTVMENMFRAERIARDKEALAYVRMSREERDAFLDQKIEEMDRHFAEMEKRRREGDAPVPPAPGQQGDRKKEEQQRSDFAARMKTHMESTPAEVRAAHSLMRREMMERRKATGKPMPKPPRHR